MLYPLVANPGFILQMKDNNEYFKKFILDKNNLAQNQILGLVHDKNILQKRLGKNYIMILLELIF